MKMVRAIGNFGQAHKGPVAYGQFWALEDCNDLPYIDIEMDVQEAIENGDLYVHNAESDGEWEIVTSVFQLSGFEMRYDDNYDRCTIEAEAYPYMPELYFVDMRVTRCPECKSPNYEFGLCDDCGFYDYDYIVSQGK